MPDTAAVDPAYAGTTKVKWLPRFKERRQVGYNRVRDGADCERQLPLLEGKHRLQVEDFAGVLQDHFRTGEGVQSFGE